MLAKNGEHEVREEVKVAERKLKHLRTLLQGTKDNLGVLDDRTEHTPVIQQQAEELSCYKEDLKKLDDEIVRLDLDDVHDLVSLHSALMKMHFDCSRDY